LKFEIDELIRLIEKSWNCFQKASCPAAKTKKTEEKMPLTDVSKIPAIMIANGWNKAALLLAHWFIGAAYTKSSKGPTAAELSTAFKFDDLGWLITQPEGKEAYEKIFSRRLWRTRDSDNGDAVTKLAKVLNAEKILAPGIKDVRFGYKNFTAIDYERGKSYTNASSFKTGVTTTLTHCVAALGSFVIKFALNGKVSHTPDFFNKNQYTVKPESIDLYLWDSFDFEDDTMFGIVPTVQPLGCWDEATNSVGKFPDRSNVCVFNSTFRDWRTTNKKGGDFYLYTDVLRATFTNSAHLAEFYIYG
jgi:hypothetical protein